MQALTRALLLRYVLAYLLVMVLTGLVVYGLHRFAGVELGGLGFIPSMLAAMSSGQLFFQRQGRRPDNGEAWRLSLLMTGFTVVLSSVVAAFLLPLGDILLRAGPVVFLLLLIILALHMLAVRLFFGLGAKVAAQSGKA